MGRDKAGIRLAGTTLLERAVGVLAAVTPQVVLASGATARYAELGLECVLDGVPDAGPLAGLAAVLARLAQEGIPYACVLACDMPAVEPEAFTCLLARARETRADVCLLASSAGREPLCGVYHVRALAAVSAALARGERRMDSFHGALDLVVASAAELGLDPACARNLNTPEELHVDVLAERGVNA